MNTSKIVLLIPKADIENICDEFHKLENGFLLKELLEVHGAVFPNNATFVVRRDLVHSNIVRMRVKGKVVGIIKFSTNFDAAGNL